MFCINCGTPLPEDANFCYKCGRKQDISLHPVLQKKGFCYQTLTKYEYDEVDMVENYNSYKNSNQKSAFIIVRKDGKFGVYDEFFEHQFVPCDYDSVSICTHDNNAMFKVFKDNRCYLFQNDKIILGQGYDDIFILNANFSPFAIEFKNANKFGFRLKKRIQSGKIGICKYAYEIYDATFDSVAINDKEKVVLVKKDNKYGLISAWGSELPCMFDSIKIERRPAKFDPTAHLLYIDNSYQQRWLILKYNGIEHEYPEMMIREPNSINYVFNIKKYNIQLLMD